MLIRNLGPIGVVGRLNLTTTGLWTFTVYRNGAAWDLSSYSDTPAVTLKVCDLRTRIDLALTGTLAITTAASGVVSYTPHATTEVLDDVSGVFEGRVYLTEATVGRGSSDPFRFSIDDAPGP